MNLKGPALGSYPSQNQSHSSGGLMDLGLNSLGSGPKPKGNFDVFDSLDNSSQNDLIGGMGNLNLSGT